MSLAERLRLALVFFLIIGIIAVEIGVIAVWIAERQGRDVRGNYFAHHLVRRISTLSFLILALCLLHAKFIEPYWIDVSKITLRTTKLKEGSRIVLVHLSDIHSTGWHKNERRIPSLVNSFHPDIICLTGDYINEIEALQAVRRMVGELRAKYGIFAVRGNWDYALCPDMDIFKDLPIKLLYHEGLRMNIQGGELYIAGLDVFGESDLKKALLGRNPRAFTILLYHYPDLIEDVKGMDIDLYLAGHTHGGQVALPFYGALVTLSKYGKRYERGLYEVGETTLYVNRGIGMESLPFRFFSRPEVAVFEIIGSGK